MLGCREEAMGKASDIREMVLKIRLKPSLSSMAHLTSREGCTHCGNINARWEPKAHVHQWPAHLQHSRGAPSNFPL